MGRIFDIKRYAIQDGPGIRTTVFFSGCPLNCAWCHNPECNLANHPKHHQTTAKEIMAEVLKDRIFYEESGGGVSFSGGEPFDQPNFLLELLKISKEEELHTVVDTCGLTSWERMQATLPLVDLFLYDIKLVDENQHKKYTGKSNKQILKNLELLAGVNQDFIIRVPLIVGITDTEENLRGIAEVVTRLGKEVHLELLPYNLFASSKYTRVGKTLELPEQHEQTREELENTASIFRDFGINVYYRD